MYDPNLTAGLTPTYTTQQYLTPATVPLNQVANQNIVDGTECTACGKAVQHQDLIKDDTQLGICPECFYVKQLSNTVHSTVITMPTSIEQSKELQYPKPVPSSGGALKKSNHKKISVSQSI